jgi:hypothetical protein
MAEHNPGEIPDRIDLNDAEQIARWSRHFGVPYEEVSQIVLRVGNSVDNVREHLLLRRSPPRDMRF